MIAARGRDNAPDVRLPLPQALHIHQPAAQLEGPHRGVILVFDPDLGTRARRDERPMNLGRGRQYTVNDLRRRLKRFEPWQDHVLIVRKLSAISYQLAAIS